MKTKPVGAGLALPGLKQCGMAGAEKGAASGAPTCKQNAGAQGDLPKGWEWKMLGELCNVILGQSPESTTYNNEKNGLPFFQGKAEFGPRYPTVAKWCSHPKKIAQKDDILISVRAPVGPTNFAPSECCIGRGLAAIRPTEGTDHLYVFYYLRKTERDLAEMGTGTTFKAISGDVLRSIEIPLAPLDQQKLIVAEIEKQFSRMDEAVAGLKRIKANLKRYKAAVLKAAVEGKLTEEWRKTHSNVETGAELLKRILVERKKKWEEKNPGKKYKEPVTPDTSNLPELPEGWVWVSLDSLIVEGPQNGLYLPKESYKAGISIIRIDDYQDDNSKPVAELRQVSTTKTNISKYGLDNQDLVINRVNSPSHLGKCLVVGSRNLPALFESNMMRLKVCPYIDVQFVSTYLRSKAGRARLIQNAKWAVNQASINQSDVGSTVIPLPPADEQAVIVSEVERCLSVATEIEGAIATNFKRAERLRQAILKGAFSGTLAKSLIMENN